MRTTEDDEDDPAAVGRSAGRPSWMIALKSNAETWLAHLPVALASPPTDNSPLARFFSRECDTGQKLLERVRNDLGDLVQVCDGKKQTNELRTLMSDLTKGMSSSSTQR